MPPLTAVTFIEKVHELLTGSVAPLRLTLLPPGIAEIEPPPQLPVKPLGFDTFSPEGSGSRKWTPVRATLEFGFVTVNDNETLDPTSTNAAPNDFEIVGAIATIRVAEAVLPFPASFEVTALVTLFFVPRDVDEMVTEKVQLELAASVALLKLMLVEFPTAVIVPPPQLPLKPLGLSTIKPDGKLSVNPTPVSEPALLGLVIVKDKDVKLPSPMLAAPKILEIVGAVATFRLALAIRPVPPLVEVIALVVLFFVPEVVPVTLTVIVQVAPTATVPLLNVTEPVPAVAVTDGAPQFPFVTSPFGVPTTSPAGRVSLNATPVSALGFTGFVIVNVNDVVPFNGI